MDDKLNIVPQCNSEENWVALKMGHLLEDLVAEIFSRGAILFTTEVLTKSLHGDSLSS